MKTKRKIYHESKYEDTFLSREDVKNAYMTSSLMSSVESTLDILYKELTEIILYNKEIARDKEVTRWIKQEQKNRKEKQKKAKEYFEKNPDGDYFISTPPLAITYLFTTVCGVCLCRENEIPKDGCYSHYWNNGKKVS